MLTNVLSTVQFLRYVCFLKNVIFINIIILSNHLLFCHLIYIILKMKLKNKNKQKPTREPKRDPSSNTERSQRYLNWNFKVWLQIKKMENWLTIINLICHTISWFLWYIKTFCCGGDTLISFVIKYKMDWVWDIKAFSSSLLHAIIARNQLPFSNYFQILYIFAQIVKYFALF